ncbi:N-acetylglucosamine kinase [Consotaella salsifontis]|uniref:BadF-type ATPase n=1 Tax=Consotaella salsifontis TaxID=1365950 RepID=A0A1T4QFC6_9HYPH|nr:BadF/BadG/BcrA/BcrD ATPase family protein [Consotaella salsifontis]SKA02346.1 BadF-type ATPase [Consotaella salsifontis]
MPHEAQLHEHAPILVGADVGASKTRIRIESAVDRQPLADITHASTGWSELGDTERARALSAAIAEAVSPFGRVAAMVAGVHGADSVQQLVMLGEPLGERYSLVRVLNDSHLVILAHGAWSGTGVIAGTGSSATATLPGGGVLTVGGWGWIFGDEGGAVGLVRSAAQRVLAAYDRADDDPLTPLLLRALDVDHPHAMSHRLATTEPRLWAGAAHVVFEAWQAGSWRAGEIIRDHGGALANLVALLRTRGGDTQTVVCAGGVITNQPLLFAAFEEALRQRVGRDIEVALLEEPPVKGAMNLARRLHQTSSGAQAAPDIHAAISVVHQTERVR